MDHKEITSKNRWTTAEIARMALVTGLYVAVTLVLSVISFGAIQIRLSEMFNYLSLYNKKYIYAVTLGVALKLLYQAPFFFNWGVIALGELASMIVGGVIIYWISKKIDLTK